MKYDGTYEILNDSDLNIKKFEDLRDEEELKNTESMIKKEGKFIEEKEKIFNDFCHYLNEEYNEVDNFTRASIEEQWGILLKSENNEEIKNKFTELKNKDN